jgi:hypothetical protein
VLVPMTSTFSLLLGGGGVSRTVGFRVRCRLLWTTAHALVQFGVGGHFLATRPNMTTGKQENTHTHTHR